MATLPNNFQISGDGAIASYDAFDFASGVGYKKFYLVGAYNSTTKQYLLTTQALGSDVENLGTGNLGTGTNTISWDATFSRPVIVAGGIAFFKHEQRVTTDSSRSAYMTIEVYRVRGVTETLIGSGIGDTTNGENLTAKKLLTFTLTETKFQIGDILRVKTIFTSSGNFCSWGWDLNNNLEASITIPFVVDI